MIYLRTERFLHPYGERIKMLQSLLVQRINNNFMSKDNFICNNDNPECLNRFFSAYQSNWMASGAPVVVWLE